MVVTYTNKVRFLLLQYTIFAFPYISACWDISNRVVLTLYAYFVHPRRATARDCAIPIYRAETIIFLNLVAIWKIRVVQTRCLQLAQPSVNTRCKATHPHFGVMCYVARLAQKAGTTRNRWELVLTHIPRQVQYK